MQDQLSGAARRSNQRITLFWRNQRQPAGRRHFNKCGAAVPGHAPVGHDGLPQRPRHKSGILRSMRGGNHGFDRSLSTVSDRDRNILRIGKNFPESFFYRLRNFSGRKAFFIRVWGDYDFHSCSLLLHNAGWHFTYPARVIGPDRRARPGMTSLASDFHFRQFFVVAGQGAMVGRAQTIGT